MNGIQLAVPVFYPMAGALLTYLIGRKSREGRNYFADFIVITEFLLLHYGALRLQGSEGILEGICGRGLHFSMDGFRGIYAVVAGFMWMMTIVFSREYFRHYRNPEPVLPVPAGDPGGHRGGLPVRGFIYHVSVF